LLSFSLFRLSQFGTLCAGMGAPLVQCQLLASQFYGALKRDCARHLS
jgi:hypothetical protein